MNSTPYQSDMATPQRSFVSESRTSEYDLLNKYRSQISSKYLPKFASTEQPLPNYQSQIGSQTTALPDSLNQSLNSSQSKEFTQNLPNFFQRNPDRSTHRDISFQRDQPEFSSAFALSHSRSALALQNALANSYRSTSDYDRSYRESSILDAQSHQQFQQQQNVPVGQNGGVFQKKVGPSFHHCENMLPTVSSHTASTVGANFGTLPNSQSAHKLGNRSALIEITPQSDPKLQQLAFELLQSPTAQTQNLNSNSKYIHRIAHIEYSTAPSNSVKQTENSLWVSTPLSNQETKTLPMQYNASTPRDSQNVIASSESNSKEPNLSQNPQPTSELSREPQVHHENAGPQTNNQGPKKAAYRLALPSLRSARSERESGASNSQGNRTVSENSFELNDTFGCQNILNERNFLLSSSKKSNTSFCSEGLREAVDAVTTSVSEELNRIFSQYRSNLGSASKTVAGNSGGGDEQKQMSPQFVLPTRNSLRNEDIIPFNNESCEMFSMVDEDPNICRPSTKGDEKAPKEDQESTVFEDAIEFSLTEEHNIISVDSQETGVSLYQAQNKLGDDLNPETQCLSEVGGRLGTGMLPQIDESRTESEADKEEKLVVSDNAIKQSQESESFCNEERKVFIKEEKGFITEVENPNFESPCKNEKSITQVSEFQTPLHEKSVDYNEYFNELKGQNDPLEQEIPTEKNIDFGDSSALISNCQKDEVIVEEDEVIGKEDEVIVKEDVENTEESTQHIENQESKISPISEVKIHECTDLKPEVDPVEPQRGEAEAESGEAKELREDEEMKQFSVASDPKEDTEKIEEVIQCTETSRDCSKGTLEDALHELNHCQFQQEAEIKYSEKLAAEIEQEMGNAINAPTDCVFKLSEPLHGGIESLDCGTPKNFSDATSEPNNVIEAEPQHDLTQEHLELAQPHTFRANPERNLRPGNEEEIQQERQSHLHSLTSDNFSDKESSKGSYQNEFYQDSAHGARSLDINRTKIYDKVHFDYSLTQTHDETSRTIQFPVTRACYQAETKRNWCSSNTSKIEKPATISSAFALSSPSTATDLHKLPDMTKSQVSLDNIVFEPKNVEIKISDIPSGVKSPSQALLKSEWLDFIDVKINKFKESLLKEIPSELALSQVSSPVQSEVFQTLKFEPRFGQSKQSSVKESGYKLQLLELDDEAPAYELPERDENDQPNIRTPQDSANNSKHFMSSVDRSRTMRMKPIFDSSNQRDARSQRKRVIPQRSVERKKPSVEPVLDSALTKRSMLSPSEKDAFYTRLARPKIKLPDETEIMQSTEWRLRDYSTEQKYENKRSCTSRSKSRDRSQMLSFNSSIRSPEPRIYEKPAMPFEFPHQGTLSTKSNQSSKVMLTQKRDEVVLKSDRACRDSVSSIEIKQASTTKASAGGIRASRFENKIYELSDLEEPRQTIKRSARASNKPSKVSAKGMTSESRNKCVRPAQKLDISNISMKSNNTSVGVYSEELTVGCHAFLREFNSNILSKIGFQ